jgi:hypothetical protein
MVTPEHLPVEDAERGPEPPTARAVGSPEGQPALLEAGR